MNWSYSLANRAGWVEWKPYEASLYLSAPLRSGCQACHKSECGKMDSNVRISHSMAFQVSCTKAITSPGNILHLLPTMETRCHMQVMPNPSPLSHFTITVKHSKPLTHTALIQNRRNSGGDGGQQQERTQLWKTCRPKSLIWANQLWSDRLWTELVFRLK